MNEIKLRDISYSYSSKKSELVLAGVSFNIKRGEMLAIKGASGSGKSTLLYLLGGLSRPNSGSLEIFGNNLNQLSDDEVTLFRNREIGFVFQKFELIPRTTLLDNILLPSKYPSESPRDSKEAVKKAYELSERLGISNILNKFPNQVSGGQQQRVAIARALLNEPSIILADEPTGNLDSHNTHETLKIFKELHAQGKTVIIITHEQEVANSCQRIIEIRDGKIVSDSSSQKEFTDVSSSKQASLNSSVLYSMGSRLSLLLSLLPFSFFNLRRNKIRSLLTMLGVTIGIAAVLSLSSLSQFARKTILQGYESMGVNKVVLEGWPNWYMKTQDLTQVSFREFDYKNDILPLKQLFPSISALSPVLRQHGKKVQYGGVEIPEAQVMGVTPEYFQISNQGLLLGKAFSSLHVERRESVCVIGYNIATRLFRQTSALGKVIYIGDERTAYGCRVLGVLKNIKTNREGAKPGDQILLPFTYLKIASSNWWENNTYTIIAKIQNFKDLENTSKSMLNFFIQKYGKTGQFQLSRDDVMVTEIKKFLNIFTILLTCISLISLFVGGIGIMNMMLVSVAERYREIGLRKSLGATQRSIRYQFLLESVILCLFAGILGLLGGFIFYESVIYAASKFTQQVEFQWIVEPYGLGISLLGIMGIGVLSGIFPAWKAQKLDIVDALRTE